MMTVRQDPARRAKLARKRAEDGSYIQDTMPRVFMIDHQKRPRPRHHQEGNVNVSLRRLIFKILQCWRDDNLKRAYQHASELELLLKKIEPSFSELHLPGKMRMAEGWFLIGAMKKNYFHIMRSLKEFDLGHGSIKEHVFKKEDYDSAHFIPQICGVYVTAAKILFQHGQYSYAKDIFQLTYHLTMGSTLNMERDNKQQEIIENAKQFAKQSLDTLRKFKCCENKKIEMETEMTAKECMTQAIENILNENLAKRGLKILKVPNGNLFEAISEQIYGKIENDALIRQKCIEYMKCQFNLFAERILDGEQGVDIKIFEVYCRRMLQAGSQGGNAEIQALSDIYERPIEIYTKDYVPVLKVVPNDSLNELSKDAIKLAYYSGKNEYHSIIDPYDSNKNNDETDIGVIESDKINTETLIVYYQVLKDTYCIEQKKTKRLIE